MDAEVVCIACATTDGEHLCEPVPLSVAIVELVATMWRESMAPAA